MPELPEVEAYRRLAEAGLGRPIATVELRDPRFLRSAVTARRLGTVLRGASFTAARRRGKLLVLDLGGTAAATGHHLGLRFGMTGRLLVDDRVGVDDLVYASNRAEPRWDRFVVGFADGGDLVVRDPRLLGGVLLDPDEQLLGPDATGVTLSQLRRALEGSAVAVKARLLDQSRLAGVGNLIADEVLWRASVAPTRRSGSLTAAEVRRLHRHLRTTLDDLDERGGSHRGDLMSFRRPGGRCPRDGAELIRSTVGGRTSWWCPRHQR